MAQSQFDIDSKVKEIENLKARIGEIGNLLEPTLDSAPGYLQPMIGVYFQKIDEQLQAEKGKIQGIEENIRQYRENLTRIAALNAQKATVDENIATIQEQIRTVGSEVYKPQTAGGSKKRRKINPTTKMKIKKSSMKIKSSKSKDIRKIKKNKDKK